MKLFVLSTVIYAQKCDEAHLCPKHQMCDFSHDTTGNCRDCPPHCQVENCMGEFGYSEFAIDDCIKNCTWVSKEQWVSRLDLF